MITCIIRTIGERTTDVCKYSLQCGGFDPIMVSEKPFSAALEKAMRKAIEIDNNLVLIVDADCVPNYYKLNIKKISRFENSKRIVLFAMSDFLSGIRRPGGVKLYNLDILKSEVNKIDKESLRPESLINKKYGFKRGKTIISNHGYDQYYRDIWRTSFYHGIKSRNQNIFPIIKNNCFSNIDNNDYKIALAGIKKGKKSDSINVPDFDYDLFGLKEKQDIDKEEYDRICTKEYGI